MSPRVPPDKTLSSAASLYTNESTCLIIDLTLHTLSRSRCTGWAAAPREHPWIFRTPRLPGLRESSSSASASWIFSVMTRSRAFIFSFSPFLFLSFLLAPSCHARENDAITNKRTRGNRGSPLRVRFTSAPLPFSSPARGMSLSPSSALVRFTPSLCRSLSLSRSQARTSAHFLIRSSRLVAHTSDCFFRSPSRAKTD